MATPVLRIATALLMALLLPTALVLPCAAEQVLYTDESLYMGQSLSYGSFSLIMQRDCNLVLYDAGRAVWASGTSNLGSNCFAKLQSDGNFVVYTDSRALWASNTQRERGNYVLVLQRDRNLVVYGTAVWSTNTCIAGADGVGVNATTDAGSPAAEAVGDDGRKMAGHVNQD